jgi:hypothetical protein
MMKRRALILSIPIMMCACTDSISDPSDAPNPTYTLSGTVSETTSAGPTPVVGAQVKAVISPWPENYFSATTDANGFYRIPRMPAGSPASLSVDKSGYVSESRSVTLDGDTRFDIQISRHPPYTLSGVVSEVTSTDLIPVEGVEVYCDSCGPQGHTFAYTDADGFYSFSDVQFGGHRLLVTKEGFRLIEPSGTYQSGTEYKDATVNGDTRFDMRLVRR